MRISDWSSDVCSSDLLGKVLLPLPLVEQLAREEVAVAVALRVEAGARVAVPVPGAPDAAAGLDQRGGEALLEGAVELVDAGDARADDEHVDLGCAHLRRPRFCTARYNLQHGPLDDGSRARPGRPLPGLRAAGERPARTGRIGGGALARKSAGRAWRARAAQDAGAR